MKRLTRLKNLNDYLRSLRLPDGSGTGVVYVVDQENAAAALARASGDQLLIAVPEESEHGRDSDGFSSTLSAAFFAVAKVNGAARTQESAVAAYDRLLGLVQALLLMIERDLTSGGCTLMSGIRLTDVQVVPQYSIFGGWSGWSVELTFEG